MLILGIIAFLAGVLLVAGEIFMRGRQNREKHKSLERARQDLAARLAALESHYPQALVMMDSRGLIRRANGAAERLFGYDEAELLGRSILRLLPFVPPGLSPLATRVAAADDRDAAEMEVLCKDHTPVKVRVTGTRAEPEARSDIYVFFEVVTAGERGDPGENAEVKHSQSHRAAASR